MNGLSPILASLSLVLVAAPVAAQFIYIDVSYKLILNPADGSRPPTNSMGGGITDEQIDGSIQLMNQRLATFFRGYRLRRIEPVREIGGRGDTTGPSQFYDTNLGDDTYQKFLIESNAIARPQVYAWNWNAINIYINKGTLGGICSFPSEVPFISSDHIVIIGVGSARGGALPLHEIGHYFWLFHTHGRCNGCGDCGPDPGDDRVGDTLEDSPCWTTDIQNEIALWNFGIFYPELSTSLRSEVDTVFTNVMSYHNGELRWSLSEGQLDRWTDAAIFERDQVTSGRTWFVDQNGTPPPGFPPEWWRNSSIFRWTTVRDGARYADDGDIILLRPGAYNETITIDRAVTLRATREGPLSIGTSTPPRL